MATSLSRWFSLAGVVICASSLLAQNPSCVTITSTAGPSPSVSFDGASLKIRAQGQIRQEGDLGAYIVASNDGATVFSRELPADSGYTVTPSANAVRVCVQAKSQAAVTASPRSDAAATQPAAAAAQPAAAATTIPADTSAAKPNCVQDPKGCDIAATLQSMAAPESPAFTALGLSPSTVTRPTSPTDFATALLSGFDQNGNFQSGVAIDVAPIFVLAHNATFWAHYSDSGVKYWWVRPLARTTFSFGTTKGANSSDPALRMATGLRVVLYDERDPRYLYGKCIAAFKPNVNDSAEEIKRKLHDQRDVCIAQNKEIWNASSLVIAGSPVWISPDGSTPNFKLSGGGFWASAALRLETWGQVTGHFQRQTGLQTPAPNTPPNPVTGSPILVSQGTTLAGGSFRFGSLKFNGNVNGLYVHKNVAGVLDSYPEFEFGLERKLTESFYLDANYRYAVGTKLSASGFLANLKWSFSKTPTMAPQGGGH
jgi:hypothetical protein